MTIDEFGIFFLILMRIGSFMVTSSIFFIKGIPYLIKIGLSIILSVLLFFIIPKEQVEPISDLLHFVFLGIGEILFGLILGYITNLIFLSIQMAGQIIDFQIGFSNATYYDPISGMNVSLYGNVYYWLAIALFFSLDGHHYLIYGLAKSFESVPLSTFSMKEKEIWDVIDFFSGSFVTAFQIAIPIVVILLLVDVVMGLLARTVPQLNIFILGMPLKVLIGVLTTILLLPAMINLMIHVIEGMPYQLDKVMKLFI